MCLQTPAIRPDCEHSFMMYPLVLRQEAKRDLVNFLEDNGVETRDMLPLTNQPVYRKRSGWNEADYPVARHINTSGFYVGCHQDLQAVGAGIYCRLHRPLFRRQADQKAGKRHPGAARRPAQPGRRRRNRAPAAGIVRPHPGVGQWHAGSVPRRAGGAGRR